VREQLGQKNVETTNSIKIKSLKGVHLAAMGCLPVVLVK
jgi:hypothetical protein